MAIALSISDLIPVDHISYLVIAIVNGIDVTQYAAEDSGEAKRD